MKAVEFPEVNVRLAEDQPEYETLPVFHNFREGTITYCFELDNEELEQVGKTGKDLVKTKDLQRSYAANFGTCLKESLIK